MTFKEKSKAPDCRLPGPSGLPIIGNAHQLNIKRPHFTLTEMAHHHGPIYKMKLLTDHWIVVNTYDLAREVCVNKGREFSGRPESYRFTACIQNGKLHLLGDLKDKSILMRQLMAKAMSLSGVSSKQIVPVSQSMMRDMFDHWSEIKKTTCSKCVGKPCFHCEDTRYCYSCRDDVCRYACRLMIKGIVGENMNHESSKIDEVMSYEHHIVDGVGPAGSGLLLDLFPWLRFLGNKAWQFLNKAFLISQDLYSFYKPRILASLDSGTTQSAMHVVLNQALQGNNEITDDFAEGLMSTLFATSISTSSSMMYVSLVVLADHPHITEKIQNELKSVVGKNTPDVKDSAKLPYTMATIIEILRNGSIAPLALPHKTVCDTSLAGYNIPKGVNVFINLWAIHHDPDFWEDPYSYKPERFLTAEGELLPPEHPKRRRVMAFGAGSRSCIGEAFARRHLFLFITSLCQTFNMRIFEKETSSSDPRTFMGPALEPRKCGVEFLPRY